MDFYTNYRYLIVPFITWFCIQSFKVIWDLVTLKKFNFKRIVGAGGMPSSHAATTVAVTTMIGRSLGTNSPVFALAVIVTFIVMYDACGVRRETGKQAKILNEIVNTPNLTNIQINEKLVELVGHTPKQVIVGAIIGFIVGMIF
jgi:hypothetical protein